MLRHGEAKVLIVDTEYGDVVGSALDLLAEKPIVIDIEDPSFVGGHRVGRTDFEQFLANGDPAWRGFGDNMSVYHRSGRGVTVAAVDTVARAHLAHIDQKIADHDMRAILRQPPSAVAAGSLR